MKNINNTKLELVKKFMEIGGQVINESPTKIPKELNKLRIALLFEEVKEYAEASGLLDYFAGLCRDEQEQFFQDSNAEYVPVISQIEQLDALVDIDYILRGTVITHGFSNIIDKAFDYVNESNMSKFCDNECKAKETVEDYTSQGIETYYKEVGDYYVIYRKGDNKILKSIDYAPVRLDNLLRK
jgi:predicted HAD superfamily Cof-like phosphohydrolase